VTGVFHESHGPFIAFNVCDFDLTCQARASTTVFTAGTAAVIARDDVNRCPALRQLDRLLGFIVTWTFASSSRLNCYGGNIGARSILLGGLRANRKTAFKSECKLPR
jgi:hypothetical protein